MSKNSPVARVLLLADTHLGFDLPFRPRVERRRRGDDFFDNFERALLPALQGQVDLVVHGGDLFYRSKVPAALVEMAMAPLVRVAEVGVPVYLVPGNHERARIPLHLWATHPRIHVFDRPRTFVCPLDQGSVALSGFPFARRVAGRLRELVRQTQHETVAADARLLCMHQTVEGAQVGVRGFTFHTGPDVVAGVEIPCGFDAVLCGHIHRAQVLTHDLRGRPLAAPVIYPGSIERTSFAEREEEKGYMLLHVDLSGGNRKPAVDVSFVPLPTRPMVALTIKPGALDPAGLADQVAERLSALAPNSVVRVALYGPGADEARAVLTAGRLRSLAPPTMNISLAPDRWGSG